MLQSFVGTFDAAGLRSLRAEEDGTAPPENREATVPFWAIIDTVELPPIEAALTLGCRSIAFELLAGRAKAFGPLCK